MSSSDRKLCLSLLLQPRTLKPGSRWWSAVQCRCHAIHWLSVQVGNVTATDPSKTDLMDSGEIYPTGAFSDGGSLRREFYAILQRLHRFCVRPDYSHCQEFHLIKPGFRAAPCLIMTFYTIKWPESEFYFLQLMRQHVDCQANIDIFCFQIFETHCKCPWTELALGIFVMFIKACFQAACFINRSSITFFFRLTLSPRSAIHAFMTF